MEPLSVIPEQEDILSYARADGSDSASLRLHEPAPADLNIFAGRPVKRFKLSHHELAAMPEPASVRPQYVVSRQALDREGTPYMRFGDLETHEQTVRNHDDTLLLVMADSAFDPGDSILYYEIETKSEAFVATMSIERRYVGLELIGGAARDAAAIDKAAATSQPYDPAIDIRADSRYPLALKSRFLQAPLNSYEWAVRLHELFGDVGAPRPTPLPPTHAWHRIGLLLDRSSRTLSATRDGQIVTTTDIGGDAAQLNSEIGLLPVFSLAKHGVARVVFGSPDLENSGFKFDLQGYIEQRQREVAATVNGLVAPGVPVRLFADFFQYYGYERAARACAAAPAGVGLRASVPARARIREAIMAGRPGAVPQILQTHFRTQLSPELARLVDEQRAHEAALKHVLADSVPSVAEMAHISTAAAAALLITPHNSRERANVLRRCKDMRLELLDRVLAEVSEASNECFGSPAFRDPKPVLRDLSRSFVDNIAARAPERHGTRALLRGYLEQEYGSDFAA